MKRELKRRSAIETMIGHAKNDGRLGKNYLLGHDGGRINVTLAAAGHNLRLILNTLRLLFAYFPAALLAAGAKSNTLRRCPSLQRSFASPFFRVNDLERPA
jgi:IS5 family transposase